MPASFRPRLESLDARELPSLTPFSFALTNGMMVSGSFDYASAAVDPTQATQQVAVSNVTIAVNGQTATLAQELSAPVATFALGQLQGVMFAYSLAGVDLASVAVTGGALSATSSAGGMISSAPPVGTPPVPPPTPTTPPPGNPVPPPNPGNVPFDWTGFVASYTTKYNATQMAQAQLQQQMLNFDGLSAFIKDLRVKWMFAATQEQKDALLLYIDAYYDQLTLLSAQIRNLEAEYFRLYCNAADEAAFLWPLVPEQFRAILLPELPPLFRVPAEYYEPLQGLI